MGDFDRVQTSANKGEAKKIGMVVVLGLVLVGVLVFHFTKQGPQVASASSENAGPVVTESAVNGDSPDKAFTALQEDPTADLLLRKASVDDTVLAGVPRNPFRMAPAWRNTIFKPLEVIPVKPQVVEDPRPQPKTPRIAAVPLRIEDYKLDMVLHQNGKLTAMINNKMVNAGMIVDKARVLEIREDGVTLQNSDSNEAPPISIAIDRKLK